MTIVFTPSKIVLGNENDKILELSSDTTNFRWGKIPTDRSIEELLQYGIINLDKPPKPTSHEVVSYVKKILDIPRAGHSGTLDPRVTGVLPVALSKATRILDTLLLAGKEYVCNMKLHKDVEEEKIKDIMKEYLGELYQRPPLRSSVKRVLRIRTIYENEIIQIKEREVLFRVSCQAGTYIRKYCLHPNTQILTTKGSVSILEFVENPETIFSYNDGKTHKKNPSAVQKIVAPANLIKITMDSGVSFTVTPDHEMLRSTFDEYKMTEAKNLEEGDFIVKGLEIPLVCEKLVIADLLDDDFLIEQDEIKEECKQAFINRFGSIREMSNQLSIDRKPFYSKSKISIKLKHLKLAGIYNEVKDRLYKFKSFRGSIIELKSLGESFFYLLGLVASDGNNTKEKNTTRYTRILFNNTRRELIEKFEDLYNDIFPHTHYSINKDDNDVWCFSTSNALMATIAASLGIKSPKKESDFSALLKIEPHLLRAYIKGYFDGDGSAYIKKYRKHVKSRISLFTVNKEEAIVLHKILLKLRIESKIFTRSKTFGDYKTTLFEVSVGNLGAEYRFIEEIGSNHPTRKEQLEKIKDFAQSSEYGDKYYIALHHHHDLVKNKTKLRPFMGGNLNRIINDRLPITRRFYKKASKHIDMSPIDDFIIEKIIDVEKVESTKFVYDMTVPESHNFLIETGYVSSNCHDIGQSLSCGAHMKELRRIRSGPFTEDDHLSTLQDLYDAYSWYLEEKDEVPLRNIILPMEYGVKHIPKLFVKDSTVDSLCHGAPLAMPGLSKYTDKFGKGDLVGIFTLKHELIALGEMQLTADSIRGSDHGILASVKRVLMPIGTYPSSKVK